MLNNKLRIDMITKPGYLNFLILITFSLIGLVSNGTTLGVLEDFKPQGRVKFYSQDKFPALNDDRSDIVRVLIIHGTGVKHEGYSFDFINNIIEDLGLSQKVRDQKKKYILDSNGVTSCTVYRLNRLNKETNKSQEFIFYSYHWSDIIKGLKENLLAYDDPHVRRGSIGRLVKEELMISQLSDFMAYNNPAIRKFLMSSLNRLAGNLLVDDEISTEQNMPMDFYLTNTRTPSTIKTSHNLHIVSGSMGSSIIADAFSELSIQVLEKLNDALKKSKYEYNDSAESENCSFWTKVELRKNFLKAKGVLIFGPHNEDYYHVIEDISFYKGININFYMLTNQLNLFHFEDINLQNPKAKAVNFLTDNCGNLLVDSVNIVAFRDPTDPLCFHVPKAIFQTDDSTIMVTNVLIRSKKWYQLFIKAHTKPFHNPKLHNLIAYGPKNHRTWNKPIFFGRKIARGE
ncbi:MAG: hypothetical protein COA58_15050 [Bacteroidetes bacterium]|nr:MAG: hypothetical protein COA58_15050 [Bacteroidota bacterium]